MSATATGRIDPITFEILRNGFRALSKIGRASCRERV